MSSSSKKPKGLFLNPAKANCSIYESGRMVYECLVLSDLFDLDYQEISVENRQIKKNYDFYAFNYHHLTMGWLDTRCVRQLPGFKLTFILETRRNSPFEFCPAQDFDAYGALDPTMHVADKRVYAFPRPLEPAPPMKPYQEPDVPVIGSFGFATQGKGFELVVEAVNREFDRAKVRINIPPGTYADAAMFNLHNRDYAEYLTELCQKTAKSGIEVEVTRDFMSKDDLIEWCGQNTLNCFLYNRNMSGLSATTDQAISSGRPLAISANDTFRHIHPYVKPYPLRSLKESIDLSMPEVAQLQEDWSPNNFARLFEKVLEDFKIFEKEFAPQSSGSFTLAKHRPSHYKRALVKIAKEIAPPIVMRAARRLRHLPRQDTALAPPRLTPLVTHVLQSHSQFNEDLLIDLLLGRKQEGFYVDIGANDPTFNSNSKRFYDRGWNGITIEPGPEPYADICKARPRDKNLNLGVGLQTGMLTLYHIPADSSLSSFDQEDATRMATLFGHRITPIEIQVRTISDILHEYASNKHIDFMSVDTEGVDLEVLKSNDWKKYRPTLVMVEMNNQSDPIRLYMGECDYFLIFNNEYNGLFVDLRTRDPFLRQMLDNSFS